MSTNEQKQKRLVKKSRAKIIQAEKTVGKLCAEQNHYFGNYFVKR